MRRDIDMLASRHYDLLVIGGGIQGACVAREASEAGLSVALIDRQDFGAATSHNSFKLIHAGFRYLQHADIKRIRQFAAETRRWLRTAPGFIRPLPFVLPTYGHGTRGREALYVALKVYSLLTYDRNSGLSNDARLPSGKMLSRAKLLDCVPGLSTDGLRGAVVWYDGQLQDADRILVQMIRRAVDCGADAANYLEAIRLRKTSNVVEGVDAVDRISGRELVIRSKMSIVCCGPWSISFLGQSELDISRGLAPSLVKGINVVVRGRRFDFGLGVASRHKSDALLGASKRMYLVTPWHDCSVIGTTHETYRDHPSDFSITIGDVSTFLDEVNEAYPELELSMDDVVYCYGGLTPGNDRGDSARLRSRISAIVDHRRTDGVEGLMTVVGVKWTTAQDLARRAIKHALRYFPDARNPRTQPALFEDGDYSRYLAASSSDGLTAWVTQAANEEMAINLSDALLRRTNLIARGELLETDVDLATDAMARVHGWSADEVRRQRAQFRNELEEHLSYLAPLVPSPDIGRHTSTGRAERAEER